MPLGEKASFSDLLFKEKKSITTREIILGRTREEAVLTCGARVLDLRRHFYLSAVHEKRIVSTTQPETQA